MSAKYQHIHREQSVLGSMSKVSLGKSCFIRIFFILFDTNRTHKQTQSLVFAVAKANVFQTKCRSFSFVVLYMEMHEKKEEIAHQVN